MNKYKLSCGQELSYPLNTLSAKARTFTSFAKHFLCLCFLTINLSAQDAEQKERPNVTPVPASERQVGIAYGLWMDHKQWKGNNCWGTPALGKYDSRDRRVIRKHAEWLYDAGVDFVWLDWSNNINYDSAKVWEGGHQDVIEDATAILFNEYAKLEKRPKISVFIGVTLAPEAVKDGRLQKKADQFYTMYVANPRYRFLLQDHEGKPLLVVYVNTPTPWPNGIPDWDDERFTVRWMTGFVSEQKSLLNNDKDRVSKYGYWSWEDRVKQTYPIRNNYPEAMVICAATRGQKVKYIPPSGRRNGATFKEQFARAREIGPKFAMIVSWNEWVRAEQPTTEISKDIEPSKEFGHFYLKLMKSEIAKFKGIKK